MKTVCAKDDCAGCMLCIDVCPFGAVSVDAEIKAYNAYINESLCTKCGLCHRQCPQNNSPEFNHPQEWFQGWSAEPSIRESSSSGGAAMEISRGFIENGGEVCTCHFKDGRFCFTFFDRTAELASAAGSKYVKSNPQGIYRLLTDRLSSGKRVLFIGLPCQVAAVLKSVEKRYVGNLYTIDLICHGSPSPKALQLYLQGKNMKLEKLEEISFRRKTSDGIVFGLCASHKAVKEYIMDEYSYAFLNSITYTENCYHCKYARLERISDVTLGDSWGSELPLEERRKGISLILCQTDKGKELLRMCALQLCPVDIDKAVTANKQLSAASKKPQTRERFMNDISKGRSFALALFCIAPWQMVKNSIKRSGLLKLFVGVGRKRRQR